MLREDRSPRTYVHVVPSTASPPSRPIPRLARPPFGLGHRRPSHVDARVGRTPSRSTTRRAASTNPATGAAAKSWCARRRARRRRAPRGSIRRRRRSARGTAETARRTPPPPRPLPQPRRSAVAHRSPVHERQRQKDERAEVDDVVVAKQERDADEPAERGQPPAARVVGIGPRERDAGGIQHDLRIVVVTRIERDVDRDRQRAPRPLNPTPFARAQT